MKITLVECILRLTGSGLRALRRFTQHSGVLLICLQEGSDYRYLGDDRSHWGQGQGE